MFRSIHRQCLLLCIFAQILLIINHFHGFNFATVQNVNISVEQIGNKILTKGIVKEISTFNTNIDIQHDKNLIVTYLTFFKHFHKMFLKQIFVISAPKNREFRELIRSTWGKPTFQKEFKMQIMFLTGKSKDTIEDANDIIQADFVDSYNNLTLKSLSMFYYIKKHQNEQFNGIYAKVILNIQFSIWN